MKSPLRMAVIAAAALGALTWVAAAEAQTGPQGPGMMQGQGQGRSAPMGPGGGMGPGRASALAALDRDGDGAVSREEFDARPNAMLMLLDANGDGAVSREEFMSGMPMGGGGMQGTMSRRAQAFDAMDKNRDNKLTPAEVGTHAGDMFALHDLDGNGKITADEMGPRFSMMR